MIVCLAEKKQPKPTPIPEPSSITIEGVEFPVRAQFLAKEKTLSDWGGTAILWSALQQNLNGQIIDSTVLWYDSEKIGFSHQGIGFEGVVLSKTKEGYQIAVNVKLSGSVLANQNTSVLKAMVTTISSRPTLVYETIYDSFTTTNTHGINKESYTAIGDCRIKIGIKDGTVTYYIKAKK